VKASQHYHLFYLSSAFAILPLPQHDLISLLFSSFCSSLQKEIEKRTGVFTQAQSAVFANATANNNDRRVNDVYSTRFISLLSFRQLQ